MVSVSVIQEVQVNGLQNSDLCVYVYICVYVCLLGVCMSMVMCDTPQSTLP